MLGKTHRTAPRLHAHFEPRGARPAPRHHRNASTMRRLTAARSSYRPSWAGSRSTAEQRKRSSQPREGNTNAG